jgi:hypothetical protein
LKKCFLIWCGEWGKKKATNVHWVLSFLTTGGVPIHYPESISLSHSFPPCLQYFLLYPYDDSFYPLFLGNPLNPIFQLHLCTLLWFKCISRSKDDIIHLPASALQSSIFPSCPILNWTRIVTINSPFSFYLFCSKYLHRIA